MWSLSLATVTASAPECGSVTISSAPSRPRASTSVCIRLLGVAKTGGFPSPLALRRSCHFAADAWGLRTRTAVAVSAREARAARAHDSVVFPVPPFCDSTLTTRGRGASGARSGARASLDVSVT